MKIRLFLLCLFVGSGAATEAFAQGIGELFKESSFSGQVQADLQYCLKDSANDPSEYAEKFLSHIYVDGNYRSKMLDAGVRFEMYQNPLPGFDANYKGWGVPNFYLTVNTNKWSITGGDFYEQFGSGMILRAYQERLLGIDNALRGGRIVYTPFSWMRMKAIAGVQRARWEWSDSWVKGGDIELDMNEWFPSMKEKGHLLQLGGSFVSKHEEDELILASADKRLNLPRNVGAFSTRLKYYTKNVSLQGEYAWKANDPSSDNGFIYRPGQALLLSASYFRQGLGISLSAKHCDNMSYRSERTALGNVLQINYLPAFTRQHTYALTAFYPYASQLNGEVAFQGDVMYKFKKGSALGGKYGMDVRLNMSHISSLKKNYTEGADHSPKGTYGYTTTLFSIGDETYYRDINVEVSRKMNRDFKLSLMYMNQLFNQFVRGKSGMIRSNIGVLEASYRITPNKQLRGELQYLSTRQDAKDWGAALVEFSYSPHWIFTLSDLYNIGGSEGHFPVASVAYSIGTHRIQLTGGSQREGYNCAGGVCRYVPSTKGIMVGYTANF